MEQQGRLILEKESNENYAPIEKPKLARRALQDLKQTDVQMSCDIHSPDNITAIVVKSEQQSRIQKSQNNEQGQVDKNTTASGSQPSSSHEPHTEGTVTGLCKSNARKEATHDSDLSDKENVAITITPKQVKAKKSKKRKQKKKKNIDKNATLSTPILVEQPPLDVDLTPNPPSGIVDIDKEYNAVSDETPYINDICTYLRNMENNLPIEQDYMKNHTQISPKMRAKLIDDLIHIHKVTNLAEEILQLTVSIIDRYLQVSHDVDLRRLEIVGFTAMFVASKHETCFFPCAFHILSYSDNNYTEQDIYQCERDILQKLGFSINRPTPLSFLTRFMRAARYYETRNLYVAQYFIDLCLVDYSMVHYKPSALAAAAVCLSFVIFYFYSPEQVWDKTLQHYTSYAIEDIKQIMSEIVKIVANVQNSEYQSVYKKYRILKNYKVAEARELQSDYLNELKFLSDMV